MSSDFLAECEVRATHAVSRSDPSTDFGFIDDPDGPRPSLPDAKFEAVSYYYGLPSRPILVYQTGTPWKKPTGPEAYCIPKEARPIFGHPIVDAWDELGPQVPCYLDSINVKWTTIDVARFIAEDEKEPGPPVLWIGVKPGSLSREHAEFAARGCIRLLKNYDLTDVEVAFRESLFTRFAGPPTSMTVPPQLLEYASFLDATADVRSPLTPALGLQIAPQAIPHVEGTGALYIRESSDSTRVFILTARHVVLPPNAVPNKLYVHKQPGRNVLLLGSKAFQNVLESIMARIGKHVFYVSHYNKQLKALATTVAGDDKDDVTQRRTRIEGLLQKEEAAIPTLDEFHTEVTKYWSPESQRILGHIAYSPPIPIGIGTNRFTEDWALIELDGKKIDWKTFRGNVISLGTDMMSTVNFIRKMYPNHETFINHTATTSFEYPVDDLLPLQGIVKDDELRRPTTLDSKGEPYLFVIKNSTGTGLTIGRANGVMSFVREYLPDGNCQTSKELAIYSRSHKDGAFSAPGDSGSIIADPKGRVVGLLNGGSGLRTDSPDVTYATPFY